MRAEPRGGFGSIVAIQAVAIAGVVLLAVALGRMGRHANRQPVVTPRLLELQRAGAEQRLRDTPADDLARLRLARALLALALVEAQRGFQDPQSGDPELDARCYRSYLAAAMARSAAARGAEAQARRIARQAADPTVRAAGWSVLSRLYYHLDDSRQQRACFERANRVAPGYLQGGRAAMRRATAPPRASPGS
jgi:hypothetical protein